MKRSVNHVTSYGQRHRRGLDRVGIRRGHVYTGAVKHFSDHASVGRRILKTFGVVILALTGS